jgi:hypothetical protein
MATNEVWGSTLEEPAADAGAVGSQQHSFEDDFALVDSPHLPLPDSRQYLASLGIYRIYDDY